MKKPIRQRLIIGGVVTLLLIVGIYAFSFSFKNKTVNEAAPVSNQSTQSGTKPSLVKTQTSTTPQATTPTTPQPSATQPTPTQPTPTQPAPSTNGTVSSGNFRSAPGERAAGTVNLIRVDGRYFVRLEGDTDIGPSPDPIVTFGNGDRAELSINLGSLKGTKGSQNYEVPDSIDISKYSQVIIYCRAFHVPIGFADLRP